MADIVDRVTRSQMMANIKSMGTNPELMIRSGLRRRRFRFRLHDKSLPGSPDLVFKRWNAVIFVHGCFWHAHECNNFKWPKTRVEWWREKLLGNRIRDERNMVLLSDMGWRYGVIWECASNSSNWDCISQELADWLVSDNESICMEA